MSNCIQSRFTQPQTTQSAHHYY